jgi:hypothetical protein
MAKRYRLLARAFMDGGLREAGHIFTLGEGELGPHRTVIHGADSVHMENQRDADREIPKARDEPLYEELVEAPEVPIEERHAQEVADFDNRANAEYGSMLARHQEERAAAKEAADGQPAQGSDANISADEPERARSIADADWATRPEHGASAADANWPGAQTGQRPMNRPFLQSGPGHDPNVPS